jgi:hypothetical protein
MPALTMSMRKFQSGKITASANRCRTGETPWVKQTVDKYHETAKLNGAIVSNLQILVYNDRLIGVDNSLCRY